MHACMHACMPNAHAGVPGCAADVGETLSVAGSDLGTKFNVTHYGDREGIYSYSNTGSCVDIFAPGVDVYAACGGPSALQHTCCTCLKESMICMQRQSLHWGPGSSLWWQEA